MSEKVILLGDVHIGVRNASPIVAEHQLSFYENQLFPYLKKHNIKRIIQLGDLFDTRKQLNNLIWYNWKNRFFQYMSDNDITFITLLGNHDCYFKNTNDINSQELYLKEFKNVRVISTPTELDVGLAIPWISPENRVEVEAAIVKTTATTLYGHLEFAGFEMMAGVVCEHGEDASLFEKFDTVYSGHFHNKNKDGNIYYIGTPLAYSWGEASDTKGFHVLDVDTMNSSFIENTSTYYHKLYYNDEGKDKSYLDTFSEDFKDCYVKLVVVHKAQPALFQMLVERINESSPIDLTIMDELDAFEGVEFSEDEVDIEDTKELMSSFVDQVDTALERDILKDYMNKAYVEAINMESL